MLAVELPDPQPPSRERTPRRRRASSNCSIWHIRSGASRTTRPSAAPSRPASRPPRATRPPTRARTDRRCTRPVTVETGPARGADASFFWDVHPAAGHSYEAWLADTITPGYAATGRNGLTDTSPDASRYRPGLGGKAKRLAAFWAGHREARRMAAAIPELGHDGYSGPSCALPGSDAPR